MNRALHVAALQVRSPRLAAQFDLSAGRRLGLAETGCQLCEKGQTVYFADTPKAPALFLERLAEFGWHSGVAVPLMVDGCQLAKAVKQMAPQTPVVLLTGWGALIQEEGGAPELVDAVISKPPRLGELREVLNRFQPVAGHNAGGDRPSVAPSS